MKNPNALLTLVAVVLISISGLKSQSDTLGHMRKEFYLSFATSSPLSITLKYKKEIGPRTYFKIGLVNLSGTYNKSMNSGPASFPINTTYYAGGVEVGFERRRSLTKKLSFFHGPALRFTSDFNQRRDLNPGASPSMRETTIKNYTGAIPYSLGFLFQVYNNFHAAIEVNPSIYATYQKGSNGLDSYSNLTTGIGFDNRYALFSFVYRY